MKAILTVTFIVLAGIVTGLCSLDDSQESHPYISATSSPRAPDDEGLPAIPYGEMLRRVADLSKQTGVVNLKDANLHDHQSEIRIWKGFGLISPRCFIIRITNGAPTAFLVTVKINGNKAVLHNGNLVYVNTPLNMPRSGWDSFLAFLRNHGIGSSVELTVDNRYFPDPDSEEIVLEMKNRSRHTMSYYNDSSKTVDGKKAFAICKQIRNEFDINLGCR